MIPRIATRAFIPARMYHETRRLGKRLGALLAIVAIAALLSPAIPRAAPYTAAKNTLVILVCDSSSCATPPFTQSQVETVMGAISYYFNNASYGNISMNVAVTPWLQVASAACGGSPTADQQAAASAGFNTANYNSFVYIGPYSSDCDAGGLPNWAGWTPDGADSYINGTSSQQVIQHEVTAQFFWGIYFGDGANAMFCQGTNYQLYDYSPSNTSCVPEFVADEFDPSGLSVYEINAPHQAMLGWLTPQLVTASGTYTIAPLEGSSGTRALNVANYYYLEYRQPIGVDGGYAGNPALSGNPVSGVMFHSPGASYAAAPTNAGATELYNENPLAPSYGSTGFQEYMANPALTPGSTYSDTTNGVSFEVLTADAAGASVSIQFTAPGDVYVSGSNSGGPVQFGPPPTFYPIEQYTGYNTINYRVVFSGGMLKAPNGIATDSSGNYWVADTNNNRLQKFSSSGAYLTQASMADYALTAKAIAVDANNNVWATDTYGDVWKFDDNGNSLAEFTNFGGQISNAAAMTIDSSGNLWITDTGNNRVVEINSSGVLVKTIGAPGAGDGEFSQPSGIGLDASGDVWVVDSGNDRVQEFSSSGTWKKNVGSAGSGNGEFNDPQGICFNSARTLFWVTDSKNYRVQKFSSSGTYVSQFGAMGSGPAKFSAPSGITLSNGVLAIADSGNNWVQEYGADGYILEFGSGVIGASSGLALTGGGQNLWIADTANNRLFSFTTDSEGVEGTWVQTVGSFGTGQVQFNAPHGLAVDRSNNLWVVDSGNNRLQQLSSTGTWLQSIGSKGVGDGQFKAPEFLALDSSGNLWIADTGNNRVEELNDSGTYVSQIGCSTGACAASSENGQFSKPTGIAVDATGNFWVGDCSNNRVQELGRDGAWLQTIGGLAAGSGNSQFSCPEGLAFDALGNLWVVDSGNNRVQEFSSSGAYLSQVGGGQENFNSPIAIAVH